jgi:hypothetical protein
MKHNPQAQSSFTEIKDRCQKRNTKILDALSTQHTDVFVLVFEDGTQANVDYKTLESLHQDAPELWSKKHHVEVV